MANYVTRRNLLRSMAVVTAATLATACTPTSTNVPAASPTGVARPAGTTPTAAIAPTQVATRAAATTPTAAPTVAARVVQGELVWLDYSGQAQADVYQSAIDDFMKKHPQVKVTYDRVAGGEYLTKVGTYVAGGQAVDVVTHDTGVFANFLDKDIIGPIDDLIQRDRYDPKQILPLVWQIFRLRGKYYTVPIAFSGFAIYYNRDIFDKAGVAYPKDGWTWDDFRETARKLTVPGQQYGFIYSWGQDMIQWLPMVWQNGGELTDPDLRKCLLGSPEAEQALQTYVDYQLRDQIAVATNQGFAFRDGNVAMVLDQPGLTNTLKNDNKFQFGSVVPPKQRRQAALLTARGITVTKVSKQRENGWELVKALTSTEVSDKLGSLNIELSPNIETSKKQEWGKTWIDMTAYGKPLPINTRLVEMRSEGGKILAKVFAAQTSLKDTIAELVATYDRLLSEAKAG